MRNFRAFSSVSCRFFTSSKIKVFVRVSVFVFSFRFPILCTSLYKWSIRCLRDRNRWKIHSAVCTWNFEFVIRNLLFFCVLEYLLRKLFTIDHCTYFCISIVSLWLQKVNDYRYLIFNFIAFLRLSMFILYKMDFNQNFLRWQLADYVTKIVWYFRVIVRHSKKQIVECFGNYVESIEF